MEVTGQLHAPVALSWYPLDKRLGGPQSRSGHGLDDRGSKVRFPAGVGNFSLNHRVQTGSGTHPVSHPIGSDDLSLGVRPGRQADHSPPSSAEFKECVELYLHSPNTPSWYRAELVYFSFSFTYKVKINAQRCLVIVNRFV
jgi:hypothetical protein